MRKILLLTLLMSVCHLAAQTKAPKLTANMQNVNAQVRAKAQTLCQYIVNVGTTAGQPGSVSDSEKDNIVRNRVPGLFWEYNEAPRKMITTYANGQRTKTHKMSDYFTALKTQSKTGINRARTYELRYVGIVGNGETKDFTYVGVTADGCKLYKNIIRICQTYHIINLGATSREGQITEKTEVDYKDIEVQLVVKPNGKAGVYLGDVTRAYRQ